MKDNNDFPQVDDEYGEDDDETEEESEREREPFMDWNDLD